MSNMLYDTFDVGTAAFRKRVSDPQLRELLAEHPVVEVGRYGGTPAAVVVAPKVFAELAADHERLEELRALMPILVAAMSTGAAVPSETLRRLGVDLGDDSWQTLNELQARFPVRIGHGEDGERIARGVLTPVGHVGELDEDLVLVEE